MATALSYIIYLTDPVRAAAQQAAYPNGIQIPPSQAASVYGVPGPAYAATGIDATGGIAMYPEDAAGWWPDLSAYYNSQTFTVTFSGIGSPGTGFPNPYPRTLDCFWVGYFLQIGASATTAVTGTTIPYLGARRWVDGFEVMGGEGGTGNIIQCSRDASRTPDGFGFAYRKNNNQLRTHTITVPRPADATLSWERFYIRLRSLPTGGDDNIWVAKGSVEAGASIILNVDTNGQLHGYFKGNTAYPGTSAGTTSVLTIGTWYRVDMRFQFLPALGTSPDQGCSYTLYLNGVQQFTSASTAAVNASSQEHASSSIGGDSSSTTHGLECDIDDWINAFEFVNSLGVPFPGLDLNSGSHVKAVRPTGFTPNHNTALWTGRGTAVAGDWRQANSIPPQDVSVLNGLSTSTASARLEVTTDYADEQRGCAAMSVGVYTPQASGNVATNASYGIANSTANLTGQTLNAGLFTSKGNMYSVGSGTRSDQLPALGDISLFLLAGPASPPGGPLVCSSLVGSAEFIGFWGLEDTTLGAVAFPLRVGVHNSAYPVLKVNNTPFRPVTAVRVYSGTYIGNAIGADLLSKIPAHWFIARALTGGGANLLTFWHSGMAGAHSVTDKGIDVGNMTQASMDDSAVPHLSRAGVNTVSNSSGVAYQWIAISDPGMRFMINGGFAHNSGVASAVNALVDSGFTPDAAFLAVESILSTGTPVLHYKGPGHTTNRASPINAADVANIATFGAGSISSLTAIHTDQPQTAFSAWRKSDGSGTVWMDITSYTGDGTGARNIALALGGTQPLFAIVVRHDGASYVKDPSHVGNLSSQIGVGTSTTAITGGGVNSLAIGATLNTGAVVYDVFVIGGTTAAAFTNPSNPFVPVPENPVTSIWPAPPAPVTLSPITLSVPQQWRLHRFDIKPRAEEHA